MPRSTSAALLIRIRGPVALLFRRAAAPVTGGSANRMGGWTPAQLHLVAATGDPAVMSSTPGFSPGALYA